MNLRRLLRKWVFDKINSVTTLNIIQVNFLSLDPFSTPVISFLIEVNFFNCNFLKKDHIIAHALYIRYFVFILFVWTEQAMSAICGSMFRLHKGIGMGRVVLKMAIFPYFMYSLSMKMNGKKICWFQFHFPGLLGTS